MTNTPGWWRKVLREALAMVLSQRVASLLTLVLVGGMAIGTIFTLFIIPCLIARDSAGAPRGRAGDEMAGIPLEPTGAEA